MRGFWIFALITGVIVVVFSASMDVSVGTGMGRVNNIGLMASRQNWTIIGGMIALAGLLILLLGGKKSGVAEDHADTRPCPLCAETIKNAAIKCKHCGADVDQAVTEPLAHGWTVRIPCKKAEEVVRAMSLLADTKYPVLEPEESVVIVGPFEHREEAKSALKVLGIRYALHGSIGWVEP